MVVSKNALVKNMGPRLREIAPAARGSQDAGSRNLGPAFLNTSVDLRIPHKEPG